MAVERVWLGALTVPTLVNVVNFMDGINGITALTTAVWGINATTVGIISDNRHLELIGAVTAGSALGFLPHNLRSERIFLGDVGSYLIGSLMALVALHPSLTIRTRLAVTAPLMPYLLDTGMTLMIRAAQGKNVLEAHREHFYQRLANDQRLSHPRVASLYATGAAVIAAITHLLLKRAGDEHR